MDRHAAYWQPLIDTGQMVIFGARARWDWLLGLGVGRPTTGEAARVRLRTTLS